MALENLGPMSLPLLSPTRSSLVMMFTSMAPGVIFRRRVSCSRALSSGSRVFCIFVYKDRRGDSGSISKYLQISLPFSKREVRNFSIWRSTISSIMFRYEVMRLARESSSFEPISW